jgi:hypothetical protein
MIPGSLRDMPNDLILNEFDNMLETVLATGNGFGTLGAPYYWGLLSYASDTCVSSTTIACGIAFEIGTGGSSVARSDTALTTPYTPAGGYTLFQDTAGQAYPQSTTTPVTATCNSGTTDYVSGISGSQIITDSVTINEVGLVMIADSTNIGPLTKQLWFHDGISPGLTVVNGDTVTVAYQINLNNPGFTDNFCKLLASWFTGNILQNGAVPVSLKATDGSTNTFYTWCGTVSAFDTSASPFATTTACTTHTGQGAMQIGQGTSAFTPATYALGSLVGATQPIGTRTYATGTGVNYWTSTFTVTGTHTITESCMGLILSSKFYCLFGLTFAGQTQTSGVPFGWTMRTGN